MALAPRAEWSNLGQPDDFDEYQAGGGCSCSTLPKELVHKGASFEIV